METRVKVVPRIADVPALAWNGLAGGNPTLFHEYLSALEESGCAAPLTGWTPCHLLAYEGDILAGAMPLYWKTNSWGEFVFDWDWADAYEQHGLSYYPKLVSCVPFTPVAGERLLSASEKIRARLLQAALELAKKSGASSLHCLFPTRIGDFPELMIRQSLQFHWRNEGYRDFEQFLSGMRHDKRKKIRAERKKLAGISYEHVRGAQLTRADWEFFFSCYLRTHELYQSPPSLNLDFFLRIGAAMPGNALLIIANRNGQRIAASLDLVSESRLLGRWWGAHEYHPGLHFEVCYYQAIEFCIENKIPLFEGGAQGEHKLARGLLPVTTQSAHWLAHPGFSLAVGEFLQRETAGMGLYVNELGESNPFKR